jgi:hypothetical protein
MRKGVLIALALTLTACASATPTPPAPSVGLYRYSELIPGTSTRDEAEAKLGTPTSINDIGNKTILLQWIDYSQSVVHVAILFGADGRMIRLQTATRQP